VVGGEDDEPLLAARRPEPVDEVEQAGEGDLAPGVLLARAARFPDSSTPEAFSAA